MRRRVILIRCKSEEIPRSGGKTARDEDDFDGLPGVMQVDGLNGGGIWDIIEYNGYLYVTVVTDKSIDGKINKQGFAMYRGEKHEDGTVEAVGTPEELLETNEYYQMFRKTL